MDNRTRTVIKQRALQQPRRGVKKTTPGMERTRFMRSQVHAEAQSRCEDCMHTAKGVLTSSVAAEGIADEGSRRRSLHCCDKTQSGAPKREPRTAGSVPPGGAPRQFVGARQARLAPGTAPGAARAVHKSGAARVTSLRIPPAGIPKGELLSALLPLNPGSRRLVLRRPPAVERRFNNAPTCGRPWPARAGRSAPWRRPPSGAWRCASP